MYTAVVNKNGQHIYFDEPMTFRLLFVVLNALELSKTDHVIISLAR